MQNVRFPDPGGKSLHEWAREVYRYFMAQSNIQGKNDPAPVALAHQSDGTLYRATAAGVLMYSPAGGTPVFSKDGAWVPISPVEPVIVRQSMRSGNGAALAAGQVNLTSIGNIVLTGGRYYIEFDMAISTTTAAAAEVIVYLADVADLTTPVENVISIPVTLPATANANAVVPLRGEFTVPAGGKTYNLIARVVGTSVIMGKANTFGLPNKMAALMVRRITG